MSCIKNKQVFLITGGICSLIIVIGISRFAYTPILPLMQEKVGFDASDAGLLASSHYLGYLIGALIASFINWKSQRSLYLKIFLAVNILANTAMGMTENYTFWVELRFISGVTSGAVFVLCSSIVVDALVNIGRVAWTGILYSGVGIGILMTGLLVPGFDYYFGWKGTWIGLAMISCILSVFVWLWLREDEYKKTVTAQMKPAKELKMISSFLPWLVFAYGCEGLGYIVSATFLVDMVQEIPELSDYASLSWVITGIAAVPSTILWGILAEKKGYVFSLTFAFLLQAIGVILPVFFYNVLGAITGSFLLGVTFMGITTMATAMIRNIYPYQSSRAIGILTTVYGIGQMAGASGGGILMTRTGHFETSILLSSSVLFLGAATLLIGRWYIHKYKRKDDSLCHM